MDIKSLNLKELASNEARETNGGFLLITAAFCAACAGVLLGVGIALWAKD